LSLDDNSTATISIEPVINDVPGGVDVECLFTGKVEEDDSSLVTVSGCMDSEETTLSIASTLGQMELWIFFLLMGPPRLSRMMRRRL